MPTAKTARLVRTGAFLGAALTLAASPLRAQDRFPTKPPAPAPVKPAAFPPFQESTLANGVRVVLVENHRDPVVAFRLVLPAGKFYDPRGREGTAEMVAGLLTKGAGKRSADDVATAIESAGGSLTGYIENDFLSLAGNVLSTDAPLAFELLGDAVARPTFPDKELDLLRTQTLSGLKLEESQPSAIASRFFNAGLYGEHPYGRKASTASVQAITKADLLAFQAARLKPRGALLVVAGDITLPKLTELAEKSFAGWTGYSAPGPTLKSPPARPATEILLVHRPGSVQSNILAGNLTTGPADPTRYAATVANKLLGGGSDARLFTILREKHGWTYGSYSNLTRPRGTGAFLASAEVRTEVTDSALVELMAQLRRLGTEPVPADELENAKNALVGSFPLQVETAQQVAERVAQVKTLGLPADYLQTYRTRLAAVTAPQLQQVARTYVRPQQALVVVVGDGAKIYEKLARVGPVRIVSAQGDPMTPADLAPRTTALPMDLGKLAARRDSFVVKVQGNAMGAQTMTVAKQGDGWVMTHDATIAGGMMKQTAIVETDAALAPRRITGTGTVQGQALRTDVTFANGRATGSTATPAQGGPKTTTVDAAVPAGTLTEETIVTVLPLLALAPNARFTINVFNARQNAVQPVTLAVTGTESVTVPAGTFDTYKVEQTGGEQPLTYNVTTAQPRRVVRIAVAGQPFAFELATK